MDTIFFSWQAKHNRINRSFIEKAMEAAIKNLKKEEAIKIELRLDDAQENVAGGIDIKEKIFQKIDKALIIVADVSLLYPENSNDKRSPNPNVLLELGYAMGVFSTKGDKVRYIPVMNTAFGKVEDLPFDIKGLSTITYNLPENCSTEAYTQELETLKSKLKVAFREILAGLEPVSVRTPVALAVEALSSISKPSRKDAVNTLSVIAAGGSTSAQEALVAALTSPMPDVREEAALALADFKEVKAKSVLLSLLEKEPNTNVAKALAQFGSSIIQELEPLLNSPNSTVQKSVAFILGEIGDKKGTAMLLTRLDTVDNSTQSYIIQTLGKIKDPAAVNHLIKLFYKPTSPKPQIKEALASIGPAALPELCKVLEDAQSEGIYPHIVEALYKIGDISSAWYLFHLVSASDRNSATATQSKQALEGMGRILELHHFATMGQELPSNNLQPRAVRQILHSESVSDQQAVEDIVRVGLNSPQSHIRIVAVKALEQVGNLQAEGGLIEVIDDPDKAVQIMVIQALGEIGGEKSAHALIKLINEHHTFSDVALTSLNRINSRPKGL